MTTRRNRRMIELQHLTKRYGDQVAVCDLSLEVAEGELLVLLGGSGCGKTTTLKMINRLIEPSAGSVRVDGDDVSQLAPHELRRRVGYAFQQVGLFPHLTVGENIGITPSLLGWTEDAIRHRVDELLALVELDPETTRDRDPSELSGEPFGALDPLTRGRLQDSFIRIRRDLGVTAVFVTHDMVEALRLGDRIAVLDNGRLVQVGTPGTLLSAPADDYVRQLLDTPRREARLVDSLLSHAPGPDSR